MLAPLATVEDLSEWVGEPINTDEDQKRALKVLNYASMLVRNQIGKPTLGESGEIVPDVAHLVTIQVASRGYLNPESFGYESVDDWRGGARPIAEEGMYLTATERGMLAKIEARKPSGIGVMRLVRDEDEASTIYVPVEGGAPPFPWYEA